MKRKNVNAIDSMQIECHRPETIYYRRLIQYTLDFMLDTDFRDTRSYSCDESYDCLDEEIRILL